jgi:hypothetical protein
VNDDALEVDDGEEHDQRPEQKRRNDAGTLGARTARGSWLGPFWGVRLLGHGIMSGWAINLGVSRRSLEAAGETHPGEGRDRRQGRTELVERMEEIGTRAAAQPSSLAFSAANSSSVSTP